MLKSVHFRDFKSLRDVTLDGLGRLNVLVGPSGCGKTSVLQGVHWLSQLAVPNAQEDNWRTHRPGRIFRGARDPSRLTSLSAESFVLGTEDAFGQIVELEGCPPHDDSADTISSFRVTLTDGGGPQTLQLPAAPNTNPRLFLSHRNLKHYGRAVFLKLDRERLSAVSYVDSEHPQLGWDGEGLASVLGFYAGAYPEALLSISDDLKKVIGNTGRIRVFPAPYTLQETESIQIGSEFVTRHMTREVRGQRFELEIQDVGFLPADLLSEGTLIILGLLTALNGPDVPYKVLLDDIDQALHPKAQRELLSALRRLLEQNPRLQIICTTHSPYLVDALEAHEVQVLTLDAKGHTHAKRLDAHPDWPKYKGMLEIGEFWGAVGEDWVAEPAG